MLAETYCFDGPGYESDRQVYQTETAVLGALLVDPLAVARVAGWLLPHHCQYVAHQAILTAILSAYDAGEPVDTISVAALLGQPEGLDSPMAYVNQLAMSVVSGTDAEYHARLVVTYWQRRQMANLGQLLTEQAPHSDPQRLSEAVQAELINTLQAGRSTVPTAEASLAKAADRILERNQQDNGLPTPWYSLSHAIGPLMPGQLIILAGRPGMGKSNIGLQMGGYIARQGHPTLYASLEMQADELHERLIRQEVEINKDEQHVEAWRDHIAQWPLAVDDEAAITLLQLRAKMHRQQLLHGQLSAVFVDHLGLMSGPGKDNYTRTTDIAKGLKQLAKDYRVPLVALCQLNRDVEKRQDKRPILSDLRDSGEIEASADKVILLYREDYYDKEKQTKDVELILAKNRSGASGFSIKLGWHPAWNKVKEKERFQYDY